MAQESAGAHGKDWTGSQFLAHVREKFPDLKNPDGSILQAWVSAKKKLGLSKPRGKKAVAKAGRTPAKRAAVASTANGQVLLSALVYVRSVGSVAAAKAELEKLEAALGDKVPF